MEFKFDGKYYLKKYKDVRTSNKNRRFPEKHYQKYGKIEKKFISKEHEVFCMGFKFDKNYYLEKYEDVKNHKKFGKLPELHFNKHGSKENRFRCKEEEIHFNKTKNIKKKYKLLNDDYGFIILRHVNNEKQNNLWIECYNCIRKFYNNKIVIIDDNSNKDFLTKKDLVNTEIIESEFPGRGEILPYYYLIKKKFFKNAIILHDSMFIIEPLDFELENVKYLWHAHTKSFDNKIIFNSFQHLRRRKHLTKRLKSNEWLLCFGGSTIISLDFLEKIEKEYRITKLTKYVTNRNLRKAFERILGIIIYTYLKKIKKKNISLFGKITDYGDIPFYFPWNDYKKRKHDNILDLPIIKVWTGR